MRLKSRQNRLKNKQANIFRTIVEAHIASAGGQATGRTNSYVKRYLLATSFEV